MQAKNLGRPSICLVGHRQEDKGSMNVHIWSNPHVQQKRNETKAFDRVKKRRKLKWDELQAQSQQVS
jgi:hypothetical protein